VFVRIDVEIRKISAIRLVYNAEKAAATRLTGWIDRFTDFFLFAHFCRLHYTRMVKWRRNEGDATKNKGA
jgi:hypothetical protein